MLEIRAAFILLFAHVFHVLAGPVVLNGRDLPRMLGKPVSELRVFDLSGAALPFQVDEVTPAGEYVLAMGDKPNAADGDGKFGDRDELVFLWDDASLFSGAPPKVAEGGVVVTLSRGAERRAVVVLADKSAPLSSKGYIRYDHAARRVATPYYYAEFAKNRFHFVRAGVADFGSGGYLDLTNELRVSIHLRTLFGLLPVQYTEDDIVCLVRRYKTGPVRLIRRGDFHLNLGLGLKGSRAAVNQICYPQAVKVPVYVNLPVRLRALFSQAYIEMTPVMRGDGKKFNFTVPSEKLVFSLEGGKTDSLHGALPTDKLFALRRGDMGYGWLLSTTMPRANLGGSGFVMRRPPSRAGTGIAECGFRLTVMDVPKGSYDITNRVLFSGGTEGDIERLAESMSVPIIIKILN